LYFSLDGFKFTLLKEYNPGSNPRVQQVETDSILLSYVTVDGTLVLLQQGVLYSS
jgi:hypothetical protein